MREKTINETLQGSTQVHSVVVDDDEIESKKNTCKYIVHPWSVIHIQNYCFFPLYLVENARESIDPIEQFSSTGDSDL